MLLVLVLQITATTIRREKPSTTNMKEESGCFTMLEIKRTHIQHHIHREELSQTILIKWKGEQKMLYYTETYVSFWEV